MNLCSMRVEVYASLWVSFLIQENESQWCFNNFLFVNFKDFVTHRGKNCKWLSHVCMIWALLKKWNCYLLLSACSNLSWLRVFFLVGFYILSVCILRVITCMTSHSSISFYLLPAVTCSYLLPAVTCSYLLVVICLSTTLISVKLLWVES